MLKYNFRILSKRMSEEREGSTLLLTFLHNMGYVGEDKAVGLAEISSALSMDVERVEAILRSLESEGYVASVLGAGGVSSFYLTGKGVIRVCSIYT